MGNTSLCIVLQAHNYKENDKMLRLFSQEWGKIDALARGCRKPTSSLIASCDVFCCADFGFNKSGDRYFVTQAVPKNNFFALRKNMNALMTAMLLIEVCDKCVMYDEPNPRLFALLAGTLFALSEDVQAQKALPFFVFKLLDILGLRPILDECVLCGGTEHLSGMNAHAGGVVCKNCSGEKVSKATIEAIKTILITPSKAIKEAGFAPSDELYALSKTWLISGLDFVPKTLELIP